eukprot:TRINITY_DN7859_c1_g2_i1.p1 TRINITY_DN7859_c1_g2~~TRINITY_DN7859_c1_g2_i1.p1  ORF type:complete len:732 (-),score=172.85 TRINITY_DN7859_c1_g2_i1:51-2207(-)
MGQACSVKKASSPKEFEIEGLGQQTEFEEVYTIGKKRAPQVFDARHKLTGSVRVVYRLSKSIHACKDGAELLLRVQHLRSFDHPAVCQLFEAFSIKGFTALAYERLDGKKIFDELTGGTKKYSESQIAGLLLQVVNGLQAAEACGISHGALCPKNIFVNSAGKVKVTDMGLAGYFKQLPCVGCTTVEEMMYMAPEVASQWLQQQVEKGRARKKAPDLDEDLEAARLRDRLLRETVTPAADIWSFAILMHVMLMGNPVSKTPGMSSLAEKIREGHVCVIRSANVSQEAASLINSMLCSSATDRPSWADVAQDPWFCQRQSMSKNAQLPKDICEHLATHHRETNFKKVMMRLIASKIPARKITRLKDCFKTLDINGDGQLSMSEFRAGLIQHPDLATEVELAFADVDYQQSGFISLEEFLAATIDAQRSLVESYLFDAFTAVDTNKDGLLDLNELQRVVQSIDTTMGNEHIEMMLHLLEEEVSGPLTFTQFRDLLLAEGECSSDVTQMKKDIKESGGVPFCNKVRRTCRQLLISGNDSVMIASSEKERDERRQVRQTVKSAQGAFAPSKDSPCPGSPAGSAPQSRKSSKAQDSEEKQGVPSASALTAAQAGKSSGATKARDAHEGTGVAVVVANRKSVKKKSVVLDPKKLGTGTSKERAGNGKTRVDPDKFGSGKGKNRLCAGKFASNGGKRVTSVIKKDKLARSVSTRQDAPLGEKDEQ